MKPLAFFFVLAAVICLHFGDAIGALWMALIAGFTLLARWRMKQGERGRPWRLTRRA